MGAITGVLALCENPFVTICFAAIAEAKRCCMFDDWVAEETKKGSQDD